MAGAVRVPAKSIFRSIEPTADVALNPVSPTTSAGDKTKVPHPCGSPHSPLPQPSVERNVVNSEGAVNSKVNPEDPQFSTPQPSCPQPVFISVVTVGEPTAEVAADGATRITVGSKLSPHGSSPQASLPHPCSG